MLLGNLIARTRHRSLPLTGRIGANNSEIAAP